jgi:hypothetical protein
MILLLEFQSGSLDFFFLLLLKCLIIYLLTFITIIINKERNRKE